MAVGLDYEDEDERKMRHITCERMYSEFGLKTASASRSWHGDSSRKRFTNSMVTTPASGRAGKRGAPFRPENQLLLAICGYILSGNPAFGLVAANTMTDTCSSSSSSSTSFWP
jgi:hypothetical protein